AVRLLLDNLFGCDVVLSHNKDGRPFLSNGYCIGISHTHGCVVIIVSKQSEVSIDVEHINNRVVRVANRFMRSDEKASGLIGYLIHWCVKETLYKLYSEDVLSFEEMRINKILGNDIEGSVESENLRRKEIVCMSYNVIDNCVLTYAIKVK
ncbi:MAG: 4'-phosphopantetheinyl transferase family protein, partial [Prevotella sp.]